MPMDQPFARSWDPSNPFHLSLNKVHHQWGWYLAVGILLILLGTIAFTDVFAATLVSVLLFGWILIVAGFFQLIHAFRTRGWKGVILHIALGALYVVVGCLTIAKPLASALSLSLLLGAFFLAMGISRSIGALSMKFPSWGWTFFGGIVDLILGVLLLIHWPATALWVIGLFVAIELLFAGWTLIMFSIALHALASKAHQAGQSRSSSPAQPTSTPA
jgi:uncharacterized membrane protein HdeD (DUF308 family)